MDKQNGVVLISVLIVVALISASVTLMLKRQNTSTDDIKTIAHQANAVQYLFSLEAFAKTLLITDIEDKKNRADSLDEDWAKGFAFAVDNGEFKAQLFDLQANLNLNNLFEYSKNSGQMVEKISPDFFGCFNRLNLVLNSSISSDNIVNYLNKKRLRKIIFPSELKKMTYVQLDDYQKIRPFLFTLDDPVAININTASDEILKCLHPQLDSESALDSIKSARPYNNIDEFYTELQQQTSLSLDAIKAHFGRGLTDIKSSYFMLKGEITIDALMLNTVSIFKRNASKITLINHSYYLQNAPY